MPKEAKKSTEQIPPRFRGETRYIMYMKTHFLRELEWVLKNHMHVFMLQGFSHNTEAY